MNRQNHTELPFGIAEKERPQGGILKKTLIFALILILALGGTIAAKVYASGQTNIFWQVEFGGDVQNSRALIANETTYLGAYSNAVQAYDSEGNLLWSNSTGGAIEAMVYDAERNRLVAGSQDRSIYIYDGTTGKEINHILLEGRVYDLDFDQKTNRLLVSQSISKSKHELLILDLATGEELNCISQKSITRAAKFASDKQHIVVGNNRGKVQLMDFEGEIIAEAKAAGEIRSMTVVPETGEVISIDKAGYVYKFDAQLNRLFRVELVGEGRAIGTSADGRWIAGGTREGDVHIMNSEGVIQFSTRQENDISQIYFGEEGCYVVTLSKDLYGFDAQRLENIGKMSALNRYSTWGIALLAALTAAMLIASFPYSRWLAKHFFRSMYRHRVAYLMLLPSFVLIIVFQYYNVFQAFYYAFTDWSLATRTMREVNFVGLANFKKMFTEGYFLLGTKNLLIMMLCSFIKLLTVPLLLAEVVFAMRTKTGASSKRRYWFRLLLVVPMVVPGVVSTLMWKNIYDPNIGALNSLLDAAGLSHLKHSWLGEESTALWSIIFMGFPFVNSFAFLVYYGGLINIPVDLFEAAKVDGSRPLWNFRHIHMPLISPQMKMLVITTFISSIQEYGSVYLLTGGGPGTATYVPGLELYYAATKFGQYGYACAMGLVMFIVILLGSLLNLRIRTQELN